MDNSLTHHGFHLQWYALEEFGWLNLTIWTTGGIIRTKEVIYGQYGEVAPWCYHIGGKKHSRPDYHLFHTDLFFDSRNRIP